MPPKARETDKKKPDQKKEEDLVLAQPLGRNQGLLGPVRTYSAIIAGIIAGTLR